MSAGRSELTANMPVSFGAVGSGVSGMGSVPGSAAVWPGTGTGATGAAASGLMFIADAAIGSGARSCSFGTTSGARCCGRGAGAAVAILEGYAGGNDALSVPWSFNNEYPATASTPAIAMMTAKTTGNRNDADSAAFRSIDEAPPVNA